MNLFVNSIIEWFDQNESAGIEETKKIPIVERVLYNDSQIIVTINIFTKSGMPIIRKYDELMGCFLNKNFRILKDDPFSNFLVPEDSISEKSKKHRDEAWELIKEIVTTSGINIFTPQFRGKLISSISKKRRKEKKTIYRHLLNFWKRGMTKNALLPNFRNCGGVGKTREGKSANETKLGKLSFCK